MKQTNLKTLNEIRTAMPAGAGETLLRKAYVKPATTMSRVLLEMDVLSGANSAICTEGYVSAGKSVSAANPFTGADTFAGETDFTTGW